MCTLRVPRATLMMLAVSILPATLSAHHSFRAEFDATRRLTLEGTVTKLEWVNPHAWIYLDVRDPDGTVTTWAIEATTPGTLTRQGLSKERLPVGARVRVEGYPARSGESKLNGRVLTLPDGTRLALAPDER